MQISHCLIIDCETDSLEEAAKVIEIGAILYSVEHQCSLQELSTLLIADGNAAEPINRIKPGALTDLALTSPLAMEMLLSMSKHADVLVAHNADFDSKRLAHIPLAQLSWLCTMADFKWPQATREQGSLINLALDHGIGVASAHRALTDCRLIASLFDRMADLQGMFQVAMRPKGLFQALVSYDDRELAKQAGFKWNGADKNWTRQMALEDAAQLAFRVRRLDQTA